MAKDVWLVPLTGGTGKKEKKEMTGSEPKDVWDAFRLMTGFVFLLLVFFSGTAAALPAVRIATIQDGPAIRYGEGAEMLFREILDLTEGEFAVSFPPELQVSGNWDVATIRKKVREMMARPDVDLVIGGGVIASHAICQMQPSPKPAIAAVVIDADLQGLPEKEGRSGIANLNYIRSFQNFERDLVSFQKVARFKRLTVIGDATVVEGIGELGDRIQRFAARHRLHIDFVPATDHANTVLSAMGPETEAVLITPLMRFSEREFSFLVEGLAARKLPSFSLWGREEVEAGILASVAPKTRVSRLVRKVALHVQQVLLGTDAGDLPVAFQPEETLTVNLKTARRIGVYPDWDVLLEAEILHREKEATDPLMTLDAAVKEAIDRNLTVRLSRRDAAISKLSVQSAKAALRPHIGLSMDGQVVDEENAAASLGRQPEQEFLISLAARQVLFSDPDRAGVAIREFTHRARLSELRQTRLDIAEDAALRYLDVLRSRRLASIRMDDLDLTRANLARAENRRDVGYASPAEVYRWESRLATARKSLLEARAVLRQSEVALNRILHQPLGGHVHIADTKLGDPLFFVSDPRIFWFSNNPGRVSVFHDFIVTKARAAAPELEQVDLAIAAANRQVTAAKRRYYLPTVAATGGYRQRLYKEGEGSDDQEIPLGPGMPAIGIPASEDQGWQVGISAELPLYAGGSRSAALDTALEQLGRLRTDRVRIAEALEARMRVALHRTTASWPAIGLSEDAADAAKKNLGLVTDAYERGVVSVMDLLDAQHAALVAEQVAATSVYDFLKDLMAVQRLLGNVDFSATLRERDAMFVALREYFEAAGIRVEMPEAQERGK